MTVPTKWVKHMIVHVVGRRPAAGDHRGQAGVSLCNACCLLRNPTETLALHDSTYARCARFVSRVAKIALSWGRIDL